MVVNHLSEQNKAPNQASPFPHVIFPFIHPLTPIETPYTTTFVSGKHP